MRAFLSDGNNKTELIRLHVVSDEQCICIKADGSSKLIEDIECNQEEAETRILQHVQHICHLTENVTIHAPETDVLIITIVVSTAILGNVCIHTSTKSNARIHRQSKTFLGGLLRLTRQRITFEITVKLLCIYWMWHCECILS